MKNKKTIPTGVTFIVLLGLALAIIPIVAEAGKGHYKHGHSNHHYYDRYDYGHSHHHHHKRHYRKRHKQHYGGYNQIYGPPRGNYNRNYYNNSYSQPRYQYAPRNNYYPTCYHL